MNNLRINITLGSFNVELEGESTDVISQLEEIKKNGLGQMVDQLMPIFQQNKQPADPSANSSQTSGVVEPILLENVSEEKINTTFVSLFDASSKMLPKSEAEWVLVYSHFICQQDKTTFTREDLLAKYEESKRNKRNNIKNLSNSIKTAVNKGWISQQTDTDYIITPDGKKYSIEILSRTESSIKTPRKLNKPKKVERDEQTQ